MAEKFEEAPGIVWGLDEWSQIRVRKNISFWSGCILTQFENVCLTNQDIIYSVGNNTSCFMLIYIYTVMFHSKDK